MLRINCKFAHYIHPAYLGEEYFEDWLQKMKSSPFKSNREAVIEGVYPIHVDRIDTQNGVELRISLYTDFWFPWNTGSDPEELAQYKEDMYDNRQLAWRHTPRLNRSLAEIKQLVIEAGGTWEVSKENVYEQYQHMVMDTGIELNMPDDVKYLKNKE